MSEGVAGQAEVIRLWTDVSCPVRRRLPEAVKAVLEEQPKAGLDPLTRWVVGPK